jgi:hypothetical protein
MLRAVNAGAIIVTLSTALFGAGCQSPTNPDDTIGVDDFVDGSITPDPVNAIDSPDGKSYRVARNNEPDEIRLYDWKATFSASIRLNDTANDKDLDLAFPVKIVSIGVTVQQASGGIVTPPTGSDTVHSEYVVRDSTGSSFAGANTANSCGVDVWYDLPSLRKEALITVAVGLVDDDGRTFTKTIDVKVNP